MLPLVLIIGNIILRLLPHIPNVAPVTATALFSGVYLKKRYVFIVPLVSMLLSDYLLLYINPFSLQHTQFNHLYPLTALFHASTPLVYTSFVISGCIGLWLRAHKTFKHIFLGTLVSSITFFLLTNFNFWYATSLYPKTLSGLLEGYIMALPFFRYTLMGDFLYTGILFGAYQLVQMRIRKIELRQVIA